jgi:hypothetical protein
MWWKGRELLTVQIVQQDPTELLASAISEHELADEDEEREVTSFTWPPPDMPEEGQRIVFTPDTNVPAPE